MDVTKENGSLSRKNAVILYVDDLLLTSKTFENHLQHLKQTLQTLGLNNLMANPTKAYIGHSSITYFGHTLTPGGVTSSDDNVKAIKILQYQKINDRYRECWAY